MQKEKTASTTHLSCSLPYPPSVNSIWKRGKYGQFLSLEGRAFKDEVTAKLRVRKNISGFPTYNQKVIVEYTLRHPDNRRRDCDNVFKLIGDCIQYAGIVENDSWLLPRCMDFTVDKENPGVEVRIYVFTGN